MKIGKKEFQELIFNKVKETRGDSHSTFMGFWANWWIENRNGIVRGGTTPIRKDGTNPRNNEKENEKRTNI
ncbi:MAG: hypothetical protein KAK00_10230 [Nanoarchaeota archaeon]|nr:hypothetical protein [Nanoarchaeota archaeon]